jgi:hypothetical protein
VPTRSRTIAAAPVRSASAAWAEVSRTLVETLEPAVAIDDSEVATEVGALTATGRKLIAGGHLAKDPLVLDAAPLRLEIRVVDGDRALTVEEKLGLVPGAATATDWQLTLPVAQLVAGGVESATEGLEHVVSTGAAKVARTSTAPTKGGFTLDPEALEKVVRGGG